MPFKEVFFFFFSAAAAAFSVVEQKNPLLQLKQSGAGIGRLKRRYKRKNASSPSKKGPSPVKRNQATNSPAKLPPPLVKPQEPVSMIKVSQKILINLKMLWFVCKVRSVIHYYPGWDPSLHINLKIWDIGIFPQNHSSSHPDTGWSLWPDRYSDCPTGMGHYHNGYKEALHLLYTLLCFFLTVDLKNMFQSESLFMLEPMEEDILQVVKYCTDLVEDKDLEKLDLIIKYMKR